MWNEWPRVGIGSNPGHRHRRLWERGKPTEIFALFLNYLYLRNFSFAMLSPFNLPEGILILVTDELSSPAEFLLHRSFVTHVKESKHSKTIILSVSEDIARWKAIATKSVCRSRTSRKLIVNRSIECERNATSGLEIALVCGRIIACPTTTSFIWFTPGDRPYLHKFEGGRGPHLSNS